MKCAELFKYIKEMSEDKWNTTGDKVDWLIETDEKNEKIRLLFEESDGFKDWVYNLFFFGFFYKKAVYKNQQSSIKAHAGFAKAYKSTNDEIMELLIKEIKEHPSFEVVIAGWSHGGALSQLAAEDLNFRTRTDKSDVNTGVKPTVVTFGSPKVFVGNVAIEYVRTCCFKIIQNAQNNDIVTYLPPLKKYKHLDANLDSKKGRLGVKWNLFKFLNPWKFHTQYDDSSLYSSEFDSINV